MIQFSVDAERLASFKERAQSATKNGYIEKGVRDTCKLINDHPHLATMWSCEGHGMYSKSPGNLLSFLQQTLLEVRFQCRLCPNLQNRIYLIFGILVCVVFIYQIHTRIWYILNLITG